MTDHRLSNVFELHRAGEAPSHRLLVVFSAANAGKFTFFKAVAGMSMDRLHIRDPNGTAWYQHGLAEGEGIADIERRIADVARDYHEIWMIGSSMGGYAALYLGARLKARRVLAIAPQIIVDSRFSRGPRGSVKIHTPDISDLVVASRRTQFTIIFGSFDLIDAYNISKLYRGDAVPMHFRVLQYRDEDHMIPVRIQETCGLKEYFQSILSKNAIPQTGMDYTEGRPLDADRLAVVERYVSYYLERDFAGIYENLSPCLETYPDWAALHHLVIESGMRAEASAPALLLPRAQALSDAYPAAIDFSFLTAQLAEQAGDEAATRAALKRVFAVRAQHPRARQMQDRLDAPAEAVTGTG